MNKVCYVSTLEMCIPPTRFSLAEPCGKCVSETPFGSSFWIRSVLEGALSRVHVSWSRATLMPHEGKGEKSIVQIQSV